jgi:PAS domain S-box-containing protein
VRAEPYREPQTDAGSSAGSAPRWTSTTGKEAEAALQDSERRMRSAILASPFPIMLHAEDGEVLELSRKWTELTGYARDEIRTHHDWARLAYPNGAAAFDEQIAKEFSSEGEVAAGEWEIRTRDGTRRIWDFYIVGLGSFRTAASSRSAQLST